MYHAKFNSSELMLCNVNGVIVQLCTQVKNVSVDRNFLLVTYIITINSIFMAGKFHNLNNRFLFIGYTVACPLFCVVLLC